VGLQDAQDEHHTRVLLQHFRDRGDGLRGRRAAVERSLGGLLLQCIGCSLKEWGIGMAKITSKIWAEACVERAAAEELPC
jgi:hypothetical protein